MKISIPNKNNFLGSLFIIAGLLCSSLCFSQPIANFSSTPISGCVPLTVTFNDLSTGNPTSWQWNLGNGIVSNQQSPTTAYFTPGTYTVSLKVSNASGSDSITKTQYITVYTKPTVNFTASTLSGCFPLTIQFSDLSSSGSGNISAWSWDFGDGDASSLQNPSYTYTTADNYSVTLKVTNSNGCSQVLSKTQYIKVSNGVTTNFSNSYSQQCSAPATINFTNLSTGPPTLSYQWNFGDGNISTVANPSNTYSAGGTYSVQLITKSSEGCIDTLLKQDSITIRNFQTDFSGPDSICIGAVANFNNTSAPVDTISMWNFGDGTISTLNNPTKIWTVPATYQVKLVNNYGVCLDSIIKPVTVLAFPIANFSATDTFNCKTPLTTQFNNLSTGGITWLWNFGDGTTSTLQNPSHTYNTLGQFTVQLIVTNSSGCSDTLSKNAYIKVGDPGFHINAPASGGCIPFTYMPTFSSTINDPNGLANYTWYFGDDSTSTLLAPNHQYASIGTYTVKLFINTNDGCYDSVITTVKTGTPSTPNFSASPLSQCVGQNIQFTDMSTAPVDTWLWNFGDGGTSTLQNPSYAYLINGPFSVTLTATNNGCSASITKNNFIQALPPVSRFTPVFSCTNQTQVTFMDNSVMPQTWAWSFGDGNTSTLQSPNYTYASLGSYTVTLTTTNNGCTDKITIPIKLIDEHPNFIVNTKDSVCTNAAVGFTATGINATNIKHYLWNYGDGFSTGGPNNTGLHTYATPGTYSVSLTTTDIHGCDTTVVKPDLIYVHGPIANFIDSPLTGCKGLSVIFTDKSTSNGINPIVNWQWSYGDGIVLNLTAPPFNHIYNTAGNFTPQLKVTDVDGCTSNFISNIPIKVISPTASFNSPDTFSCVGASIIFNNTSSGANLTYLWSLGNGLSSTQQNPVTSYSIDSDYSVSLIVTDTNSCSDTLQLNNYIKIKSVKASFNVNDSVSSCPPFEVDFTNTSENNVGQLWDFGDGTTSDAKNPVHYYTVAGTYIATLYATRQGGCIDSFKNTIQLFSSFATLTYSPIAGCSQLTVNFHISIEGPSQYFVDFGNGTTTSSSDSVITNIYNFPGNYVPKVIITDSSGCLIPLTGTDTIHLTKSYVNFYAADSAQCLGNTTIFTDSTTTNSTINSWLWNFGDGATSTLKNPTHYYNADGRYPVQLMVQTTDGCYDSLTKNNYINIYGPTATFTSSALSGCKALNILFTDNSITDGIHPITNWYWDFGDNVTGNDSASTFNYVYDTAGYFIPKLKIEDSFGCSDSFSLSMPIHVITTTPIFNSSDTLACIGSNVFFNNTSFGTNLQYQWSFGNGATSTLQNPVTSYTNDTSYTITLIVTDSIGCSDTLVKNNYIVVNVIPQAAIEGDTVACIFAPLTLNGVLLQPYKTSIAWQWNFGNGNTSSTQNPSQQYATPGIFPVQLIASSSDNCADTIIQNVLIHPLPSVSAGPAQYITEGETIPLKPMYSGDVINWLWTPATGLSCYNCPDPFASPSKTTVYTVNVANQYQCTAEDSLTIILPCEGEVFIPNAFTPNNDGKNDVFYPLGKSIASIESMSIYDRWDKMIFHRQNFSPNDASTGWDGTYNGKAAAPDTYVYIIEIICSDNNISTFKGNVTLIR